MAFPKSFTLNLPLYVIAGLDKNKDKNKKLWLNQNNYRNWHFRTQSKTKILFKKAVADQIQALPDLTALWKQVHLTYFFYPPDRMKRDLTNSMSVIDKYFQDALVEFNKLEDDSFTFVPEVSCKLKKIDRANPRMEVLITPFCDSDEKTNPGIYHARN